MIKKVFVAFGFLFFILGLSISFSQVNITSTVPQDVSCFGVCDGKLTITYNSSGVGPFEITATNGAVGYSSKDTTAALTYTIDDLCAASTPYGLQVKDLSTNQSNGGGAVISGPLEIVINTISNTAAQCFDSCDGSITLALFGDGPFNYAWSSGGMGSVGSFTNISESDLCAGEYTITVEDNNGCTTVFDKDDESDFEIPEPLGLSINFNTTDPSCAGEDDGQIIANVTGGTVLGGYTYDWSGSPTGDGTNTITGLVQGNYTLSVTDDNGCPGEASTSLTDPLAIDIDTFITNVDCNGASTGSIRLEVSGGLAPYAFNWSTGATIDSITNQPANSYDVTVTDNNGAGSCPVELTIEITEPTELISGKGEVSIECNGDLTGKAYVSPSGGTPPYDILWINTATTDTISGLAAFSPGYDVTITDGNDCQITETVEVTQNPPIVSDLNFQNISCFGFGDGYVAVDPSGGAGVPFSYTWSVPSGNVDSIGDLSAGTYFVTIEDAAGCELIESQFISEPPAFDLGFSSTDVTCFGASDGAAVSSPSGGTLPYTFTWEDPSSNPLTTVPGSGDSAVADLTGGNGYSLTVTDNAGCFLVETFDVVEDGQLFFNISLTNNICFGDENGLASSNVSGGTLPYNYAWSTTETTPSISGLASGSYDLTITDASACTYDTTIVITEGSEILSNITKVDASCNQCDGTASTALAGGSGTLSHQWTFTDVNGPNQTSNGALITDLCEGTVYIDITDQNTGCILRDSVAIEEPDNIDVNPDSSNVTCVGFSDGSATVTPAGGMPFAGTDYNFEWSTGPGDNSTGATATISGLSAGTYTVSIIDAEPCTTTYTFTIQTESDISLTADVDSAACNTIQDGEIVVHAINGVAPYNFDIGSGTGTDSTFSGLAEGDYTISVTDANTCLKTIDVRVGANVVLEASISKVELDCFGEANGRMDINPFGGSGPYSYIWSHDALLTSDVAAGLSENTYFITVNDANGCELTLEDSITAPDSLELTLSKVDPPCFGDELGDIVSSVNGGVSPYAYAWDDLSNSTSSNLNDVGSGTYTLTVTDDNGCSVIGSETLTTASPLQGVADPISSDCGLSNGVAVVDPISGGVPPYTHSWNTGATSTSLNPVAGGVIYTDTIRDQNGCELVVEVPVPENGGPTAVTTSFSNISCYNANDGTVGITGIVNGVEPYSFLWNDDNATTDSTVQNLGPDTLVVRITDDNGCTIFSDPIILTEPDSIQLNATLIHPTCAGATNGNIVLNTFGGIPPYTYLWDNGSGQDNLTGVDAGTYNVTITDAIGCINTQSFTLNNSNNLSASLNVTNITCGYLNDGEIQAVVLGGAMPYTYQWNLTANNQTTAIATNLDTGLYRVTITDNDGCSVIQTGAITGNQPMDGTGVITNATCGNTDGSVVVSPSGGVAAVDYSYNWLQPSGNTTNTLAATNAGIKTVEITDDLGCKDTLVFTISNSDGPVVDKSITNATCYGGADGEASLNVLSGNGPFTFSWSPGGETTPSVSGLSSGLYIASTTDALGCISVDSVQISEPDSIAIGSIINHVSCFDGADGNITLIPSDGVVPYSFNWSNRETTQFVTDLSAGAISVTITDNNGCSSSKSFQINQPLEISLLSNNISDVSCFDQDNGRIEVSAQGGTPLYSYSWGNGQTGPVNNQLTAGTYNLTITDANNCSFTDNFTVDQPTQITLTENTVNTNCGVCVGSLNVTPSGGSSPYIYAWSNAGSVNGFNDELCAGTYALTVTDNNNCQTDTLYVINNIDGPQVSVDNDSLLCNGDDNGALEASVTSIHGPFTYLWNDPNNQTSNIASNLSAGTYQVIVSDTNDCPGIAIAQVAQPEALSVEINLTDANCNATGDVSAIAQVNGGISPYIYAWASGSTTNNQTALSPGTENIAITDNNGCLLSGSVDVVDTNTLQVEVDFQSITCNGNNDGFIALDVSGGLLPYTYTWSNAAPASFNGNLSANTYFYTVSDADGCEHLGSVEIIEPTALTLDVIGNNAACPNDLSASAQADVNGGTSPYTFNWAPSGQTSQIISGITAGTHAVTVTDHNGCIIDGSALITEPLALDIDTGFTKPDCNVSDGEIIVTPSNGGTPPFTYQWDAAAGAQTDSIADNLAAGTYLLTITDANNCENLYTFHLSNNTGPDVDLQVQNVSCGETSDGAITAVITGGTLPYNYVWNDASTDSVRTNLVADLYVFSVTDGNNCLIIESDSVRNSIELEIIADQRNVSCNAPNDGYVHLTVSGGAPPYTYNWSNAETDSDIDDLVVGEYSVIISDAGSCVNFDTFNITVADPISVMANITNASCFGYTDGGIGVQATGGVSPYTYAWSNTQVGDTIGNLDAANSYTVTVTDAADCHYDTTIALSSPPMITATFEYTEANCNQSDGEIRIFTGGGTGDSTNFTYNWTSGAATGITNDTVSNIPAGLYTVDVTDSLGCIQEFTAGLNNINAPIINLDITDESCLGTGDGKAIAQVSGGIPPYTYLWHTGSTADSIENQIGGQITFTVTDDNGCISVEVDSIDGGANLIVDANVINISCNGTNSGEIALVVSGGTTPYSFNWASGENTQSISNLSAGMYYYTVSDAISCALEDSAQIINVAPIDITTLIDSIKCNGATGSIFLNALGGNPPYAFAWSTGGNTDSLTNVQAGPYSVTITDASMCLFDTAFVLTEPTAITPNFAFVPPSCTVNDGQIATTITGSLPPYDIQWGANAANANTTTITNLFADAYHYTITDANNCVVMDSVGLSNDPGPVLAVDSIKEVSCYGYEDGFIDLSVLSIDTPLTYLWSSGQTTLDITDISGGGYSITVTDTLMCQAVQVFDVREPDSLTISIQIEHVSCFGACDATAAVLETGGTQPYQYAWNDPNNQTTQIATGLCPDTITAFVTDTNNCVSQATAVIVEPTQLEINILSVDSSICSKSNEGAIDISANGGVSPYTYNWVGPDGYTATTEDANNIISGGYTVIVADSNGCEIREDTTVFAQIVVQIDSVLFDSVVCEGNLANLTSFTSGFDLSYTWLYNGTVLDSTPNITHTPDLGTQEYVLNISFNGCTDTDTSVVLSASNPIIDAGENLATLGDLCEVLGGSPTGPNIADYQWFPTEGLDDPNAQNPEACAEENTLYYLTVTDANGCVSTDSVLLEVFPDIVYIPGFTPNGDGNNDTWEITNLGEFPEVIVQIFNRWGQKLWESSPGYPEPWDGMYKGKNLPVGSYYFVINLNNPAYPNPITGPITIIR